MTTTTTTETNFHKTMNAMEIANITWIYGGACGMDAKVHRMIQRIAGVETLVIDVTVTRYNPEIKYNQTVFAWSFYPVGKNRNPKVLNNVQFRCFQYFCLDQWISDDDTCNAQTNALYHMIMNRM